MKRRGFTLVEAVATMGILAVIGSAASLLIHDAASAFARSGDTARAHREASMAVERLTRAWREIGAAGGAPAIAEVSPTAMEWDGDWSVALAGGTLEFVEDGGPACALAVGVAGLTIRAFDEAGAELSLPRSGPACAPIRRLSLELSLERGSALETIRTRVFIRAFMGGGG